MFKNNQISVTDEHSGFPSTLIIKSTIEQVHMLIFNKRRITINEVANQLHISYSHKESSSVDFNFVKFVWAPKQFTKWHICNCLDICNHFWDKYSWRGQHIFKSYCCWWWIVNSTLWARANVKSMEWKHQTFCAKIGSNLSQQWGMLCSHCYWIWSNCSLSIIKKGITINSTRYSENAWRAEASDLE